MYFGGYRRARDARAISEGFAGIMLERKGNMFELTNIELVFPALFYVLICIILIFGAFGEKEHRIEYILTCIGLKLSAIFFLLLGFFR